MANPIIAKVMRGAVVESRHRGSYVVVDAEGGISQSTGRIDLPVFPRSAFKAFQCLPLLESGAAEKFSISDEEIALCCSSHSGEPEHVRVARSILLKAGLDEDCYECGVHWPTAQNAAFKLVRDKVHAAQIHNNCSGKHAGMLVLAKHLGVHRTGYVNASHPVQQAIAAAISKICNIDLKVAPIAVDGCSVPTWAMPLFNMALGFARLSNPNHIAGRRIISAASSFPFLIAGTACFDTRLMEALPRVFVKMGAEGVYCGCIPHAGLGFALKCDDGAVRAAEVATAGLLMKLNVWTPYELVVLKSFVVEQNRNWRKVEVGDIHSTIY